MVNWKRMLFIINPTAGMRKRDSMIEVVNTFTAAGYEPTIFYTRYHGHATEIVIQHGTWTDLIVCMGGDGTLNEVVAGVCELGLKKPIGYIPAGSTNDFASSIHLPLNPVDAAESIVTGTPRYFDIGSFQGRTFIYTASVGLFTSTSYDTPQEYKNVLGHFAYVLTGIKDLSKTKKIPLTFRSGEHTWSGDYIFAAICNTTSIGGVMSFDSDIVDFQDGLFELFLVKYPRDVIELNQILAAVTNKDYNTEFVSLLKLSHLEIDNPTKADWSIDGEKEEGKEHVAFKVLHDNVQIIY